MTVSGQSRPRSSSRTPSGLEARKAALAMVEAALHRRGGMEATEGSALSGLEARDRGFARALALATLRWLGPIDRELGKRLKRPPPDPVIALLRIGVAQMLALDTPAHAAVSTTLDLTTRPFVKLVNAVLRGIDRERPTPAPADFAPDWLMARWRAAYGEAAEAIAARIAEEPPTDLSLRNPTGAAALAEALEGMVLPGGSVRTARRGDVASWPGFDDGSWWVQDAAAAMPARLLKLQPDETALDLCAAPGGKTMQLAAAGTRVIALDKSADRLGRVKDNLARTGLTAELVAVDAETWSDPRLFDGALLDAPCSSTGTFRRNPDVLWTCKPSDIASLAGAQARLLDAAARRVKPGGRLVYCVCSLEPEEGEGQVPPFLSRCPEFALEPVHPGEGGLTAEAIRPDGTVRLHPGMAEPAGGLDGFFVARFRRRE